MLAPSFVSAFTAFGDVTFLLFGASIAALLGVGIAGLRLGLAAATVLPVVIAVTALANPYPLAASALMVALGAGVAASSRRGLDPLTSFVAAQASLVVVRDLDQLGLADWPLIGQIPALPLALTALVGGLWALLVVRLVRPPIPATPLEPASTRAAFAYGIGLCLLLGMATFLTSTYLHGGTAGWLMLTVIVIGRPSYQGTRLQAIERVLGTVVGGMVCAIIVILVGEPPWLVAFGTLVGLAALVVQLTSRSNIVFVALLTAAIVLMSGSEDGRLLTDLERILFTLVGAAAVVLIAAVLRWVYRRSVPAGG